MSTTQKFTLDSDAGKPVQMRIDVLQVENEGAVFNIIISDNGRDIGGINGITMKKGSSLVLDAMINNKDSKQ